MPAAADGSDEAPVMIESRIVELAGGRLDARPGHREAECGAAELAGQLDILGIAVHEIGRATAEGLPTLPLPQIADVLPLRIVRLALVVGRRDAEQK